MECSNCGKKTNRVRTSHFTNVNGKMINRMPKGEEWCLDCVLTKKLPTLNYHP